MLIGITYGARGLKHCTRNRQRQLGAWIETTYNDAPVGMDGRASHGVCDTHARTHEIWALARL